MISLPRVVITGVGLTSPNGNSLPEYRKVREGEHEPVVVFVVGAVHQRERLFLPEARVDERHRNRRYVPGRGAVAEPFKLLHGFFPPSGCGERVARSGSRRSAVSKCVRMRGCLNREGREDRQTARPRRNSFEN